jgi:hypothetical protein
MHDPRAHAQSRERAPCCPSPPGHCVVGGATHGSSQWARSLSECCLPIGPGSWGTGLGSFFKLGLQRGLHQGANAFSLV